MKLKKNTTVSAAMVIVSLMILVYGCTTMDGLMKRLSPAGTETTGGY